MKTPADSNRALIPLIPLVGMTRREWTPLRWPLRLTNKKEDEGRKYKPILVMTVKAYRHKVADYS